MFEQEKDWNSKKKFQKNGFNEFYDSNSKLRKKNIWERKKLFI